MTRSFNEKITRQSELLQILILDALYALSGSHGIIFQGGTALRLVYGGPRFSEDLDFLSGIAENQIKRMLNKSFSKIEMGCAAQFGPGKLELQIKEGREGAVKSFFVYRPEKQRGRIAVKVEFEEAIIGREPAVNRFILRELQVVSAVIITGRLMLPYASSILVAETADEILADKIRAIYERPYIKGRDVFDIWWLVSQLKLSPKMSLVRATLGRYRQIFRPARNPGYFQTREAVSEIAQALEADLPRFLPADIFSFYREKQFHELIETTAVVTASLLNDGLEDALNAASER